MSWLVDWQGTEIDIDFLDFDMSDWEQVEQRAGVVGFGDMLTAMSEWSPVAWKALYWIAARRAGLDPGTFADFKGPTYRALLRQTEQRDAFALELQKLAGDDPKDSPPSPPDSGGSEPSEPSTDGAALTSSTG